ncbi:hypothetical protein JK361_23905 [Streptomyces sp. 5-8]|uniref:Secreted protein n=1 Tax=Streptomyces musisoli TaxID=2802280 RepID=A0ABS1P5F8_9ACTN|nr:MULTISPECIES: hypothetical protein [Streptomyces]MBL1107607.1 hypothetical protein [Streptomyces musisoli]MBY8842725.1 hypothetical protein [Streptomyces sp. SP2-10]
MQQSAVPELAHTQTRPIHWVATATAVAGVVALSALVQPGSATAAQTTTDIRTRSAPAALAPPSTTGVDFPLQCGPVKAVVTKKATADLDGDGQPETVAVVHCDAPMGTPPDGIYVLTRSTHSNKPRVIATLVQPKERLTVTDFAIHERAVSATLLGYSSDTVPSCCPDTKTPATWQWNGNAFLRSTPAGAHSV